MPQHSDAHRSATPDRPLRPIDDAIGKFAEAIERQTQLGRRRTLVPRSVVGPHIVTESGERLLNFGGNDYLGVVSEGLVTEGLVTEGLVTGGLVTGGGIDSHVSTATGATASALVCGWSPHHQRLAEAVARLEKAEAAVIFPSGYAACSGAVATLCGEGDWILSDQLNHASLIDGCRLSRATKTVYPHCDVAFVEQELRRRRDQFASVWIVTDGVFSMDGDTAPLDRLADVADRYRAQLLVDEAHGTGVLGESGGGLCEAMGLQSRIPIRIGTLSKAVGHQGGFVAGPTAVIGFLIQFCRTLIYSTALPPGTAESAARVLESLPTWTDRREKIARLSRRLRDHLRLPSDPIKPSNPIKPNNPIKPSNPIDRGIPIVPVIVGSDRAAIRASKSLRAAGFFVPAIRPPTVPEGTARLRISISATHDENHIDQLASAIASARQTHASGVT